MPVSSKECEVAAARGKIRWLRRLLDEGHEVTSGIAEEAVQGGHLDLLQWLYRWVRMRDLDKAERIFSQSLFTTAAEHGQIAIVKWGMKVRAICRTQDCAEFCSIERSIGISKVGRAQRVEDGSLDFV